VKVKIAAGKRWLTPHRSPWTIALEWRYSMPSAHWNNFYKDISHHIDPRDTYHAPAKWCHLSKHLYFVCMPQWSHVASKVIPCKWNQEMTPHLGLRKAGHEDAQAVSTRVLLYRASTCNHQHKSDARWGEMRWSTHGGGFADHEFRTHETSSGQLLSPNDELGKCPQNLHQMQLLYQLGWLPLWPVMKVAFHSLWQVSWWDAAQYAGGHCHHKSTSNFCPTSFQL